MLYGEPSGNRVCTQERADMYADSVAFDWLSHSDVNGDATTPTRHWPCYLTFLVIEASVSSLLKVVGCNVHYIGCVLLRMS